MSGVRTAVVIGGGIAGQVAAVALQRAGIEPTVHEAHDRDADGVGAFLGLGLNGIDALRTVGMEAPVIARGIATPRMVLLNGRGRVLADVPNGGVLHDGTSAITIRRPDLYAALRDEAERRSIPTEYGMRLTGIRHTDGGVQAQFADGRTAEADVLVGADGIRSTTRRLLDPKAPDASYVGFLNTGGHARGVDVPGPAGVNHLCFGRRAFFGWVKAPDGEVWWFANPPAPHEPDPGGLAAIPAELWRARLLDLFADDRTPAVDLIRATDDVFSPWITYDLPSVPTWHDRRTVVIGDAAHAVSPSAGQGAAMAIEDAVVLARCLRDLDDAPVALARYEQLRRERVERVRAQGRRNGTGKTVGPLGRVVRDLVLPLVMRQLFRNGRDPLRWMWDHHIDWDTSVTLSAATAVAR
ncbi:FAD-dependent oxidoreductase [Geodermatophilus sabuli]|uniref:2-polyprenyl-6-methoxyphenol hydroxylase n=1 Tax=Geodermatophilus sabuli TaxID=1564158 RepID=A0A285EAQ6_9ACTN|nr:FAD-dependent monooxygenase [Geodermatophilus sabuli]MBB3085411.1 2-polyprenyl-6-methoxyphenol hydroxylase-like FAD-dependent oxidoreductase [Geodermatophilus sabuli]SNX96162.1 2-polyprenyl-6-methoxyphenol hydroxylase [Geodermatophilus sabuli]